MIQNYFTKKVFIFTFFIVSFFAIAQTITWEKNLGGVSSDFSYATQSTSDGGYIVVGYTNSSASGDITGTSRGSSDVWIVKLDSSGAITWQKNYGSSFSDGAFYGVQTTDGGYILTGYTGGANGDITGPAKGAGDVLILKLDSSGSITWQRTLGGSSVDQGSSIAQLSDGSYVFVGYTYSSANGDVTATNKGVEDVWMGRLASNGTLTWQKSVGGSGSDVANSVYPTSDGGFVMAGYTASSANGDVSGVSKGNQDVWIVKFDNSGAITWQKNYGGSAQDQAKSIVQTADGGYIVAGLTSSSANGDVSGTSKGGQDAWILKLDAQGDLIWQKNYGGSASDIANSVVQTTDGGYVLTGATSSSATGDVTGTSKGNQDVWVVKLDASGNILTQNNFGGSSADVGMSIIQNQDGSYFLAGYTGSSASGNVSSTSRGGNDIWILKLNPQTLSIANTLKKSFAVSPNPAKDFVNISNFNKGAQISLYDMTGKLLFSTKALSATVSIDTSSYQNGVYVLTVDGQSSKLLISK